MQNLYIGKVAKYEKFTKYGFCAAREKPEGGVYRPPPGHIGLKVIAHSTPQNIPCLSNRCEFMLNMLVFD